MSAGGRRPRGGVVLLLAVVLVLGVRVAAQPAAAPGTGSAPELDDDADPTRPVLFSLRPEWYAPSSDIDRAALIVRYDRAALVRRRWLPGQRGVIFRFEAPLAFVSVADGPTRAGLGDVYAQLLLLPYRTPRFAFVAGTGLLVPTASDARLGGGKWVVAPASGPLWFFDGRGLFFLKIQPFVTVAGDPDRPDVDFLLITPTFLHTFGRRWWVLVDSETRTIWTSGGTTGVKSGVQIGRAIAPRFGVWVKPEVWWGPNRGGQWNLKVGLVWHRR